MSESTTRPRLLDLVQAGLRELLTLTESENRREAGPKPASLEGGKSSIEDRFPVPSRELAYRLVNVPREDWSRETNRSVEEVLDDVTTDMREALAATLADFAFAAIDSGDSVLGLSTSGRFSNDFVRELMRTLPIDPYMAPEVLERLHAELLTLVRSRSVEASWGRLAEQEGELMIVLPQRSVLARRAATLPG